MDRNILFGAGKGDLKHSPGAKSYSQKENGFLKITTATKKPRHRAQWR